MARNTGTRNPTEILGRPDFVQPVVLTTGTSNAVSFDTPTGMGYVAFAMNVDFWAVYGSTGVTIPATNSTGSTGSELNPTIRNIGSTQSCTGITLASEYAGKGSLAWYKP